MCVHVPVRARLGLYARNLGGTPLDVWARARSCLVGYVHTLNLSLRPYTSVHVPVRAGLGWYGPKNRL